MLKTNCLQPIPLPQNLLTQIIQLIGFEKTAEDV